MPEKKIPDDLCIVFTEKAPLPQGHYSQAIVHDHCVYVSGQLPIDPQTGKKCTATIEEQTERALKNVFEILKASGSDKSQVLKTTVYLADMALWDRVNNVYARFFEDHRPARSIVPTKNLHGDFQIEIEAIAAVNEKRL